MMKTLGIITFLLVSMFTFAQPNTADVETVNGKKYYVHFVEQGQTLYGIHQLYNVSVADITNSNKGVDSGLQIGQKILVPIPLNNSKFYGEHKVEKGETLYGISKKYKCSVADLKNLNPQLNESGLSIGQVLKIPLANTNNRPHPPTESIIQDPKVMNIPGDTVSVIYTDSIITHKVLKHETLYSISKRYMVTVQSIKELNEIKKNKVKEGDLIKIKVKNVNYEIVENNLLLDTIQIDSANINTQILKKEKYKIALLLPLMLAQNQRYLDKPMKVGEVRELHPTTKIAADFYHGFMLAADSLSQAGLNVEIFVYDTKKDTNTIKSIFNKSEFNNMDLIIGPFYPKTINIVAHFCKVNKVPMVIPFNSGTKVLYQNPNVFKATSSNMTLIDGAVDFIVDEYGHYNVSIIKPSSTSDLILYEKARDRFNSSIGSNSKAMNSKIIELSLGNSNGRDMNIKLRKDTVNVVIVPSTNLKFISGVFTRLNNVLNLNPYAKNMKIIVFGLEDWNKYEDLDLKHRMRLHQHYASYRYINYNASKTNKIILSFRNKYATDPDVYAVQGFDIGYYFMSAMYLYGVNFESYIDKYQVDLIQNKFNFPKDLDQNGRENKSVSIIEYSNYELILKK